jgi:hypothetical protein
MRSARRKKGSYFNAQFYRLTGRRGPKKAACAVAASLLTTIYHLEVWAAPPAPLAWRTKDLRLHDGIPFIDGSACAAGSPRGAVVSCQAARRLSLPPFLIGFSVKCFVT